MKNVFRDLYNGEFMPFERRPICNDENRVNIKIEDAKRYFVQKMSLDDVEKFQKLEDLYMDSSHYEQEGAFAYGFKMGLMLGVAVFEDEN